MRNSCYSPRTFRDTGLLPLVRLKQNECRWPVDHHVKAIGGYLFCGDQTDGHVYCATHRALGGAKELNRDARPAEYRHWPPADLIRGHATERDFATFKTEAGSGSY
jgi:hypothetical protein